MPAEMKRRDVSIYTTSSFYGGFYDRARRRAGGAERQMTLLARTLASTGYKVAHIVYRPRDPVAVDDANLALVYRLPYGGDRRIIGGLVEAIRIWRALRQADGVVTVVRSASPAVGVAGLFARLHRRRFVFSSANDSDFVRSSFGGGLYGRLYKLGVRLADTIVVQSKDQQRLAEQAFPGRRIVHIPSFAEAGSRPVDQTPEPTLFLWIGRVVADKQPMRYVELAQAVPEARFIMIPVLEGPASQLLDEIRAASAGIPNLELLDPLPHAEVMALMAEAVAVVNTSIFEGMPNVFLEAWAQGVPALTLQFDPDGVITRRGLGVSADGSWETFVSAARRLWDERLHREELSGRTRGYLDEVHSIEAVGAHWSELINGLARTRRTWRGGVDPA
jgi:glycosyltransferase involved in cell wall biosynthesis